MNRSLRIISLIPSATEIVYLLELGDFLVALSHDSNYPRQTLKKPVISDSLISLDLSSREIDEKVRESVHTGRSLFHIDQTLLQSLKPNLILTQELCHVCAPSFSEVKKACKILRGGVDIVSLEPESIEDMLENILTVGEYADRKKEAFSVVAQLKNQLATLSEKISKTKAKPTAVVIEWLAPIMIAGHWVPEMVERAGGKMLLSQAYAKSRQASWQEVVKANPDILIFAPCGFDIERTKKEINLFTSHIEWEKLKAVKNKQIFFVDGDAYLTRSGPRLIEGCYILAHIFHPDVIQPNNYQGFESFYG